MDNKLTHEFLHWQQQPKKKKNVLQQWERKNFLAIKLKQISKCRHRVATKRTIRPAF